MLLGARWGRDGGRRCPRQAPRGRHPLCRKPRRNAGSCWSGAGSDDHGPPLVRAGPRHENRPPRGAESGVDAVAVGHLLEAAIRSAIGGWVENSFATPARGTGWRSSGRVRRRPLRWQRQRRGAGSQLAQRAGQGQRVAGDLRRLVGLVLAGPADRQLDQPAATGRGDQQQPASGPRGRRRRRRADQQRTSAGTRGHDHAGQGGGDRARSGCRGCRRGQLVAEDPAQLPLVEQPRMPSVQQTAALRGVAAGGEGVGGLGRARCRGAASAAVPRSRARGRSVHHRRLGLADRAGVHRAEASLSRFQ